MSASKEKRLRREQAAAGIVDPKIVREEQERRAAKRSNLLYAAIAVVFVLVAVVALVSKSGVLQRKATAVTIDGKSYTAAEVQYYYTNNYQNFLNQYYYYLSYIGLDTSKSLKDQECGMTGEGTWYDYFMDAATDQMAGIQKLCEAAEADGFVWNDEMQATFDASMENLQSNIDSYNTSNSSSLDMDGYLKLVFGNLMTKSVFEEQVKNNILAQAYSAQYQDSLAYSDSDLEAAYAEARNTYDTVAYRMVTVSGKAASTKDADGNTVEPTEEESAAARKAAEALANQIYASYQAGESLSALADANEGATYSSSDSAGYSDSTLMNWLFDTGRSAGNSAVLFDEVTSNYYVVVFGSRSRQEYNTVDVRHILVMVDESELDSEANTYEADLQAKKDEAKAKAEEILQEWKSGAATEDSFAELANTYSEDGGSNTNGGYYGQVRKGDMVESFNDWIFDASRSSGDADIVYAERVGTGSDYRGYHIIYFVGEDLPYWKIQVQNNLISEDYNEWYSGIVGEPSIELHNSGLRHVG